MKTIKFKIHLYDTFLALSWFHDRNYAGTLSYNYRGYYYFPSEIRFIIRGILEQFKGIHD